MPLFTEVPVPCQEMIDIHVCIRGNHFVSVSMVFQLDMADNWNIFFIF